MTIVEEIRQAAVGASRLTMQEVELRPAVVHADPPDEPGRGAGHERMGRDVFDDTGPGADRRVHADPSTTDDDRVRAD